jgi:pseudouridine-5'-phosphate glycosidase
VPVPEEFEIKASLIDSALDQAIGEASSNGIRGKAVTPFLLAKLEKLTAGRTVETNRALLIHNATVAAKIAASLARLKSQSL